MKEIVKEIDLIPGMIVKLCTYGQVKETDVRLGIVDDMVPMFGEIHEVTHVFRPDDGFNMRFDIPCEDYNEWTGDWVYDVNWIEEIVYDPRTTDELPDPSDEDLALLLGI